MMCAQMLGGATGIVVAQKIFEDRLLASMRRLAPDVDRSTILKSGATSLTALVPDSQLDDARNGYSDAVTATFYLSTGLAAASLFAACCLEWKSIKTTKTDGKTQSQARDTHPYRLSLSYTLSSLKM
jgi:hypothetical protein